MLENSSYVWHLKLDWEVWNKDQYLGRITGKDFHVVAGRNPSEAIQDLLRRLEATGDYKNTGVVQAQRGDELYT
jgi:hypothetical protein